MKIRIMTGVFVFAVLLAGVCYSETYRFCENEWNCIPLKNCKGRKDWKLVKAPAGVEIIDVPGVLAWKPEKSQAGTHEIEISFTDADGKEKTKKFSVNVVPLKKAMFVFAHGDDEFCIMGRIKQLVDAGVDVQCYWTVNRSKVRNRESAAAMHKIGLTDDKIHFKTYCKMKNGKQLDSAVDRFAKIIKKGNYDQIYANAFEAGHDQHDKTGFIVVQAAKKAGFTGQIYEYSLYNFYGGRPNPFALIPSSMPSIELVISDDDLKFFESLVEIYQSQKMVTMAFLMGMSKDQKKHLRYRAVPAWDYTRQPHPGKLWCEIPLRAGTCDFKKDVITPAKEYFKLNPEPKKLFEQDRSPEEKTYYRYVLGKGMTVDSQPASKPSGVLKGLMAPEK